MVKETVSEQKDKDSIKESELLSRYFAKKNVGDRSLANGELEDEIRRCWKEGEKRGKESVGDRRTLYWRVRLVRKRYEG